MDQVPLLAMLLPIFKENQEGLFFVSLELLLAVALHYTLLVLPVKVEVNYCLVVCEE